MEVNIGLMDEITMIFFWVGLTGILDKVINISALKKQNTYIYIFLILVGLYFKL
jgi:hypothetical protein